MAERTLWASTYGKDPTRITATVTEYDRAARFWRATRIGLPLLGGAFVSLFIPAIGHVAGVPGFLIASVVFSVRRLREDVLLESLVGACPACAKEQQLAAEGRLRLPLTLRCPACMEFLKIDVPSQGAPLLVT